MYCTRLAGNAGRKKIAKKSPPGHQRTTLSGYIFATKIRIDNRKKLVKQQYPLQMSSEYGALRPTTGWYRFVSLGHPSKFQRVSRLGSVTARHSTSGRQPNFAVLNRGRHLYSTGRPSRWALADIVVIILVCVVRPSQSWTVSERYKTTTFTVYVTVDLWPSHVLQLLFRNTV